MIDFSKIKFSERQLGTFGNLEISGGIKLEKKVSIDPDTIYNNSAAQSAVRDRIKYEIYQEIYGELKEELDNLNRLKHKNSYYPGIFDKPSEFRPYFLNDEEVLNILNKINDLLKMPE